MSTLSAVLQWFTDPANWTGPNGIPTRLVEHVQLSAESVALGALIALPVGIVLGHYGRYGNDAEDSRIWPLYLGDENFIRGYGYHSFQPEECLGTATSSCPVFDRLFGSRILVGNAEFRIPLLGTPEFGLINFPIIPLEVSPFFDAGVSYAANQNPDFRFSQSGTGSTVSADCTNPTQTGNTSQFIVCTDRIPVFSTGVSFRANVLGYLIFEAYLAHPFQRPQRDWVWGFQLAPGW